MDASVAMADADRTREAGLEIEAYLQAQEATGLLRFIACGSVDDGKSTLIGRLLHDATPLLTDQRANLERDSERFGTTGAGKLDLALLVDGLAAEREQGITIDVAYRRFATARRTFVVADTPGHEQYTRNMATGASTADLAVLLVDARKGLLTQTRRHSVIVALLGIRHVALAVNKMDAVGWDRAVFERIAAEYDAFARQIGITGVTAIPLSALTGDNVTQPSPTMPWYAGPTLLAHLETVEVADRMEERPFRLPVQWVNRPDASFRGFAGSVACGTVRPGDPVVVLPGGRRSTVARLVTYDGDLPAAVAGQAVTLVLADEIDISRGDVIAAAAAPAEVADQFAAHLVWMSEQPMLPGRPYLLQVGTTTSGVRVTELKHVLDVETLTPRPADRLALNEVAVCNLVLDRPVPFEPYRENRTLGGFILIDRMSNATVACGMIDFALRRAANLHPQTMTVDKAARGALKGQKPCVLWLTGLSGAGKSTVADLVERELHRRGRHTMSLDGDNVRLGLNRDLGFTDADRVENIRRVAEVAKLMVDAGLIVLVSFISPFRSERRMARELLADGEFLEIFVDAPLELCESRDPKGLYRKARTGRLPNFTGIDSPYEAPETPELHLRAGTETPEAMAARVLSLLDDRGVL